MIGDSWDGGGRPSTHLVSTGLSKKGCGHLLGPLISAGGWPHLASYGFSRGGGGVDDNNSTIREKEGAELCRPNSALGGQHHAEVRATRNGCVRAPDKGAARFAQHFNHSTGTTWHQSWKRATSKGRSEDLKNLCSICPLGGELRARISRPWLQPPW